MVETPIYNGTRLKEGNRMEGHGVIEEPTITVVIPPGFNCTVNNYSTYIIERSK
jgi:N-methylhydantoinase A